MLAQGASQQLKLSVSEKDALLPRLVQEHWLAADPNNIGRYCIGVCSLSFPRQVHHYAPSQLLQHL